MFLVELEEQSVESRKMLLRLLYLSLFSFYIVVGTSSSTQTSTPVPLGENMPNVCSYEEPILTATQSPCQKTFLRVVRVRKIGCRGGSEECYEYQPRRFSYASQEGQYNEGRQKKYKCCHGWLQKGDDVGCLHRMCEVNICSNEGTCSIGRQGQKCECKAGFQGSLCQYDINECQLNNGGCEYVCENIIGSFVCTCPLGYVTSSSPANRCVDIDECLYNNGGCKHQCTNTIGSHLCFCPDGLLETPAGCYQHFSGPKLARTGCEFLNGGCSQRCVSSESHVRGFFCDCIPPFELKNDDKTCILPDGIPISCSLLGCSHLCKEDDEGPKCKCPSGLSLHIDAKTCKDRNECLLPTHGCTERCFNTIGSYMCGCNEGSRLASDGKRCFRVTIEMVDACGSNNGGCSDACVDEAGVAVCQCPSGFQLNQDGKNCEDTDECAVKNGGCSGICRNVIGAFDCYCPDGRTVEKDSGKNCAADA